MLRAPTTLARNLAGSASTDKPAPGDAGGSSARSADYSAVWAAGPTDSTAAPSLSVSSTAMAYDAPASGGLAKSLREVRNRTRTALLALHACSRSECARVWPGRQSSVHVPLHHAPVDESTSTPPSQHAALSNTSTYLRPCVHPPMRPLSHPPAPAPAPAAHSAALS